MKPTAHTEWWRPDVVGDHDERSGTVAAAREPDSAVPFGGLLVFTFILLLAPQSFFPALAPLRIALLTAGVAVGAYLADRLMHRRPLMQSTPEMWKTVGLAGLALLTVPFSLWPGGSLSFLLEVYFKTLVIFWLLSHTVNTLSRLRQVAWGLSLMGLPLAVTAVQNFLSGTFVEGGVHRAVKRIAGYDAALTANPNDLALMLNLILPLAVALLLVNRQFIARVVLLSVVCLNVIAVIITFSRAGFLTLATTCVVYVWKYRGRPGWGFAIVALVLLPLLGIPLMPSGYVDHLGTIFDIETDQTGSAQERWATMLAALRFVLDNPIIGAGVGANELAINTELGAHWRLVHNVYLEHAVELGLPGLVLFLSLLAGCIKATRFVQRQSAQVPALRPLFCLAEGIQISLIAFAVSALFLPVSYNFYFYYIAGLAVAVKAIYQAEARHAEGDQEQSEGVPASAAEVGFSMRGRYAAGQN